MKSLLTASCLLVLAALSLQDAGRPSTSEPNSEDYDVYSVALDKYMVEAKAEQMVIGDHTLMAFPPIMMGMTRFGDQLAEIRKTASKDLFDDYESKNKNGVPLAGRFVTKRPVVLISEQERDRIFESKGQGEKRTANPKGMAELRRLYPGAPGFSNLSRIGFGKDHSE